MKSLINYFLILVAIALSAASAENPVVDPKTSDPSPAPLPEPTIPVPMPEPAFPVQESEEGAEIPPLLLPVAEVPEAVISEPPSHRPFWECQLPSGCFAVGVSDMVTVSYHEYVIDHEATVYETTITTRSALMARFYYRTEAPVTSSGVMTSPLHEGREALERAQTLIATGRHLLRRKVDHGLPVKRAAEVALAPTVEYRLQNKADVVALYQSAHAAWKNWEDGLFRVADTQ
ncbi:MAG: hypothetical protein ACI9DF_000796 [Verrucomicrobiales bacterium]